MRTAVLDTLETLLVPGKRARLSPFVETTQFVVLTGERPDDRRRAESAQAILERHEGRIREIARHWAAFANQGKSFAANDYSHRNFLDSYLAYYFTANVCKIQLVLLDLVRAGLLSGRVSLLDIGVGTGTTAIALLDFLLAWGQVCDLYGQPFPITDVHLAGVDRSEGSIGHARRVVDTYRDVLQHRLDSRRAAEGVPAGQEQHPDVLQWARSWASSATWRQLDLDTALPRLDTEPNLVVMANVWNELRPPGRANAETLLHRLPQGATLVVIEPGTKAAATDLMAWRKRFVDQNPTFIPLAPLRYPTL